MTHPTQRHSGLQVPPSASGALEHEWVWVIVTSRRTNHEVERFVAGERRVLKRLDLSGAPNEDIRSIAAMCSVCRFTPTKAGDVATPCKGRRLDRG